LHRKTGADITIVSGTSETAILKSKKQRENLEQLFSYIPKDFEFIICEGVDNQNLDRIVVAKEASQVDNYVNQRAIAISGIVASKALTHRLPLVDVTRNPEKLAELVKKLG
jgi:molybdopterin-guanine dinucleotide biosynthesis protein MobB